MDSFDNWVVTGAVSGIGHAMVTRFLAADDPRHLRFRVCPAGLPGLDGADTGVPDVPGVERTVDTTRKGDS